MKPRSNTRRDRDRQHLHSVDQIVDMMRARMRDLVGEWKLQGYVDGHEYVALNPLRADRSYGSFRICLTGPLQGLVRDFASGDNWSALSFTAALWYGGNNVQALKWAKAWLGLDGCDPAALQQTRKAVAIADRHSGQADIEAEEKARKTRAYASMLWLSVDRGILGTPVDAYLAGRGIDLRALQFEPGAIRYHPGLTCTELGKDQFGKDQVLPAMMTIIQDGKGNNLALHRTFLDIKPDGTVSKAAGLTDQKKVLGRYKGGFISLQKGISIDAETGEWKKHPPLSRCKSPVWIDVTEGIENGLSVAIADLGARVVAAVSLANMANLVFPPIVEGVVLWRDNDAPGSAADIAFGKVVAAFQAQGKRVKVVRMPDGVKDVNDVLRGKI